MKIVDNIFMGIYRFLLSLASVFLASMIIIIFANVFLRYLFDSGLYWSEEVSLTLVVWFTCIALVLGVHESRHININVLPANTPKQFLKFCTILKNLVGVAVGLLFLVFGLILAISMKDFTYTSLPIPASLRYIFLPVSGIFVIYFSLKSLFSKDESKGAIK